MKKLLFYILFLMIISCKNKLEIQPIEQDIKELVFASGQLEWDNTYNLTAQTDGILVNLKYDIGTNLPKGAIAAIINNPSNEINTETANAQFKITNENVTESSPALQQLQINIRFAQSKYNQDKIVAERYQRLYQKQSVSAVSNENMQLAAANSLANLDALKKQYQQILLQAQQQNIAAKAQLKNTQIISSYNKIVAPENGTVIKKFKTEGDYVRRGESVAAIANEGSIKAILNVDENSIGKIKIGQQAFVKLNINKQKIYTAKISKIMSAFDAPSQSFICEILFDNPPTETYFGTQLEANILVAEKKKALLIPRSYMGFGNKVNVKDKDETIVIKTGIVSSDYVEVLGGIDKDDILLPLKP